MNGAAFLGIEVDPERIERRSQDRLLRRDGQRSGRSAAHPARSDASARLRPSAWLATAPKSFPNSSAAAIRPRPADRPDQRARSRSNGYIPRATPWRQAAELRGVDPQEYRKRALDSIATHVARMLELQRRAPSRSTTATTYAVWPTTAVWQAFDFPGFVPEYIRPLFCEGRGPFRWVALSGDPADIALRTAGPADCSPALRILTRWISPGPQARAFSGPARAHLLAGLRRTRRFAHGDQRPGGQRRA